MRSHTLGRGRAVTASLLVTSALLLSGTLTPTPAHAAGGTLTVDVSSPFKPVTRVAAGGLYALKDASTPPDDALLQALRPHTHTQPAPGVQQKPNGQPAGGDALVVAGKAERTGAGEIIRMPDIYPDFPYRWVSWDDWLGKVDTMVDKRLAATGATNIRGWELWNEPDWTWNTAAAGPFDDGWARTFKAVRAKDSVTPIVGPSDSAYSSARMRDFLTSARASGTVPDVICWHELVSRPDLIASHVADYRAIEADLGLTPRPISVNEYGAPAEIDVPGRISSYISKLERAKVWSADRAFWYEYGTFNGLLTTSAYQPTASYWLYKWYGDMAGNMVTTTPSSLSGLDGFASYDTTRKAVDVVFGNEAGTNTVNVKGLAPLGSTVKVTLRSTPGSGRTTAVTAPTTVSTTTHQVSNGAISVSVPNMNADAAYQLAITPAGAATDYQHRYEAENSSVFRAESLSSAGASNGGYVGRIDNIGDARTHSYVDFVVNVPTSRAYQLSIGYANGTGAAATQGLAYNGGAWTTVSYPPTAGWGQFGATVSQTVTLRAGYNVIRLAKGSPGFAGGTGYAELDYIQVD
ncbi:CBM35 domain-containing protein [Streptomyces aurantiacus]|uniref:CBM35 domain-containing protein n=1 Tax=Streptomyces aurantiacus TaxID=47760 RepID=UPI0006E1D36A|nr:CBM35 domain-containing protein [Streptomyces aurantiacus]